MKYQFRIVIAFAILLTSFLFFNVYKEVEEETQNQLEEQLKTHAQLASKGILQFFQNYNDNLGFLSRLEAVKNNSRESNSILKEFYENHSDFVSGITRIGADGRIIQTFPVVNSVIGKDVSQQEHNRLIMETHEPVISRVITAVQGYQTVVVAYPVFRDSVYNGCLSLLIPFEHITSLFLKNIRIGKEGYARMVSKEGIELYCKYPDHVGIKSNLTFHDSISEIFDQQFPDNLSANSASPQNPIGDSFESNELKYYYPVNLGGTAWTIVVTAKREEVMAIMNGFRNKLLLIALSFIIITFTYSYLYYRRRLNLAEKIREQKDLFSTIGRETGLVLYDYNIHNGNIEWSGAIETTLCYPEKEMNGIQVNEWKGLIHPDDIDKVNSALDKAIRKNSNYYSEYRFRTAGNKYVYIEDNAVPLSGNDGTISRLVGIMKDISEHKTIEEVLIKNQENLEKIVIERTEALNKKNAELKNDILKRQKIEIELRSAKEQAEVSDRLKSEFLAQMSHEIRTPISTIMNFTALLKMEFGNRTSEENSHSFHAIENAANRLLRTIDLVLNLSDIEAGTYKPHLIKINLQHHILMPLINEFEIIAKRKGLRIQFNADPEIQDITLDRYTITQIFANLIDNAIKYTNEGDVTINLSQNNEIYLCEIIDTGIGISDEYLPQLFNVFSQEEQGYTRKYEGSGLGLALVKNYCEINNALIEVESKKGIGSKFTVKIMK